MEIVILGAGNVATHLAKALQLANVDIVQVWSYHYENAVILANQVKAEAIGNLASLKLDADICLIAVKDDAIPLMIAQLKNFKGIVAHTSGAVGLDALKSLEDYGVFYPLQTFSKDKEVDFSNIPICIESNNDSTLTTLTSLANKLSNNVLEINSDKRKILHLAAVFACNFTNNLYALAGELLKDNDLDFGILRPLIAETANKVQNQLPLEVQTGPAVRGDLDTLKKHQQLLEKDPELLKIYTTLSESIKKTR